jgi:retinol dehydrogenase 12
MTKLSFANFVYEQFSTVPLVKADLTGKTVMVIGANTGLGYEATKHFASMNPGRLILGCRDSEKSRNAVKSLFLKLFASIYKY